MKTQLLNKNSRKLKVSTCCPSKRIIKQSALKFFNVRCNVTCNSQMLSTSYREFLSVLWVNNSGGGLVPIMASTRRLCPKGVVSSSFRSIKRVGISPVKKCERVGLLSAPPVNISADSWQAVGWHVGQYTGWYMASIPVNTQLIWGCIVSGISVDESGNLSIKYWPIVSTDTQLTGAQITQDPMIVLFQDLVAILKSCSSTEREIFDMVIRYLQLICTSNSMIKPFEWSLHDLQYFCTNTAIYFLLSSLMY